MDTSAHDRGEMEASIKELKEEQERQKSQIMCHLNVIKQEIKDLRDIHAKRDIHTTELHNELEEEIKEVRESQKIKHIRYEYEIKRDITYLREVQCKHGHLIKNIHNIIEEEINERKQAQVKDHGEVRGEIDKIKVGLRELTEKIDLIFDRQENLIQETEGRTSSYDTTLLKMDNGNLLSGRHTVRESEFQSQLSLFIDGKERYLQEEDIDEVDETICKYIF